MSGQRKRRRVGGDGGVGARAMGGAAGADDVASDTVPFRSGELTWGRAWGDCPINLAAGHDYTGSAPDKRPIAPPGRRALN